MDIEGISREFRDNERKFDHLETEAKYVISKALEATDIKLHSITSRVKKLPSFLDKIQRLEAKKPFVDIKDIVGLRVICLFLSDIALIGEIIRDSFSVISEDNKIEGSNVSSFGYMSVHFIAEMKKEYAGPRYDPIANLPFEIQVRTIAMDAWANVSHYLEYKSETDIPTDLRRDFYALSGLFYVADKHFEMFFGSRTQSREELAEAFAKTSASTGQEINLDSLSEYLSNKFPDRGRSDAKSISELISELTDAGFRYVGEIDAELERGYEAFLEYERDEPPFGEKGRKYLDMGVVRGCWI